jgi:hypothetical protein
MNSVQRFKTGTFKNDATLIKEIVNLFPEVLSPILNVPGLIPAVAFQPISLKIIEHMSKNGGNVLGLTPKGPLMSMSTSLLSPHSPNSILYTSYTL